MLTASRLRDTLREHVAKVVFTKKNGEERTMFATLIPEYLPKKDYKKDPSKSPFNDNLVVCFDTEIGQWRSIIPDAVIKIECDDKWKN